MSKGSIIILAVAVSAVALLIGAAAGMSYAERLAHKREYTITTTRSDGTVLVSRIYADSITFTPETMEFIDDGRAAVTTMAGKAINIR
jgi:hypothetical protein